MIVLVGVCFFGLLFCAAARGALTEFSRSKLEAYCRGRNIEILGDILEHDDDVAGALRGWMRILLLAMTVALYASFDAPGREGGWRWVQQLALLWLGLLAAETWLARPLGEAFAEPFLYWTWSALNALRVAMAPVLWLANAVGGALDLVRGRRLDEPVSAIQEEILAVVNEGEREGAILGDAVEMIHGLMELHEVQVSQIMTPRTDVVMLPLSMSIEEASREVVESGHSRLPVFHSSRDDIVGILYAKDLLPHLHDPESPGRSLASLSLRKPLYVPENKPVDVLLRDFQKQRIHLAVVLDDYGGVAGLVTIEDVIEEIVGEIQDEYDEEDAPTVQIIDERTAEVDARLDIDCVNDQTGLNIPEGPDYDTIGGFVVANIGRIPHPGEFFVHNGAKFTVLDASDRAVRRLRVERVDQAANGRPVGDAAAD